MRDAVGGSPLPRRAGERSAREGRTRWRRCEARWSRWGRRGASTPRDATDARVLGRADSRRRVAPRVDGSPPTSRARPPWSRLPSRRATHDHRAAQHPRKLPYGLMVGVVGDAEALGEWEPENAYKLKWTEGHIWTGRVELPANVAPCSTSSSPCTSRDSTRGRSTATASSPWTGPRSSPSAARSEDRSR